MAAGAQAERAGTDLVPADHDGMAAFRGPNATTILVRNHELSTSGVIGSPSLATGEKGRVWFTAAVGRLTSFLLGFREAFPRKDQP